MLNVLLIIGVENLLQNLTKFFSLNQDLINQLSQIHKFLHHLYDFIMFLHMPLPLFLVTKILLFFIPSFQECMLSTKCK